MEHSATLKIGYVSVFFKRKISLQKNELVSLSILWKQALFSSCKNLSCLNCYFGIAITWALGKLDWLYIVTNTSAPTLYARDAFVKQSLRKKTKVCIKLHFNSPEETEYIR